MFFGLSVTIVEDYRLFAYSCFCLPLTMCVCVCVCMYSCRSMHVCIYVFMCLCSAVSNGMQFVMYEEFGGQYSKRYVQVRYAPGNKPNAPGAFEWTDRDGKFSHHISLESISDVYLGKDVSENLIGASDMCGAPSLPLDTHIYTYIKPLV